MNISNVEIHNFKGIDDLEIIFKTGFNLIKGENGKGKTSILEAIVVGLGGYVAGVDGVDTRHFTKDEIKKVFYPTGDGTLAAKYQLPTQVTLTVDMDNGDVFTWTRGRTSTNASRSTIQPRDIVKYAENISNKENSILPLISYQSAGRVWTQKREKNKKVSRKKNLRTYGYNDALIDASNTKLLLNWCLKMEQVSWQKKQSIAEYEASKKAVADFMNYMEDRNDCSVFYDNQTDDLMYKAGDICLPINDLSAGYQSMIWMVFDIAYRMALLNPFLLDYITETPGIILIDEIDLHLHPKWQWSIINALKNVFPNIQFIATTHSPFLFASAKDVFVIDIDDKQPKYKMSHYGIDIKTSVKQFQGDYDLPKDVEMDVNRFYSAMDNENYNDAKKILDDLIIKTAPESPLIEDMRAMYQIETTFIEE